MVLQNKYKRATSNRYKKSHGISRGGERGRGRGGRAMARGEYGRQFPELPGGDVDRNGNGGEDEEEEEENEVEVEEDGDGGEVERGLRDGHHPEEETKRTRDSNELDNKSKKNNSKMKTKPIHRHEADTNQSSSSSSRRLTEEEQEEEEERQRLQALEDEEISSFIAKQISNSDSATSDSLPSSSLLSLNDQDEVEIDTTSALYRKLYLNGKGKGKAGKVVVMNKEELNGLDEMKDEIERAEAVRAIKSRFTRKSPSSSSTRPSSSPSPSFPNPSSNLNSKRQPRPFQQQQQQQRQKSQFGGSVYEEDEEEEQEGGRVRNGNRNEEDDFDKFLEDTMTGGGDGRVYDNKNKDGRRWNSGGNHDLKEKINNFDIASSSSPPPPAAAATATDDFLDQVLSDQSGTFGVSKTATRGIVKTGGGGGAEW